MKTQTDIIRERLDFIERPYLSADDLELVLKDIPALYGARELSRFGMISVIRRGKCYYNMVSRSLPNPYAIAAAYVGEGEYAVAGIPLYNRYGFTTQLSSRYVVYGTEFSKDRSMLGAEFEFRKTKPEFLFGLEELDTGPGGMRAKVFDRERAVLEYVREFKRLPDRLEYLDPGKLRSYIERYPIRVVARKSKILLSKAGIL